MPHCSSAESRVCSSPPSCWCPSLLLFLPPGATDLEVMQQFSCHLHSDLALAELSSSPSLLEERAPDGASPQLAEARRDISGAFLLFEAV